MASQQLWDLRLLWERSGSAGDAPGVDYLVGIPFRDQPLPNCSITATFLGESGLVIKKVTLLLSLSAVSVGSWTLTRGHSQALSCNTFIGRNRSPHAGTMCTSATSSYLVGVALTMGGMFIVTMVILAMVKHARSDNWGNRFPIVPRQYQHVVEVFAPQESETALSPQTTFAPTMTPRRAELAHAAH